MKINEFGKTKNGEQTHLFTLENSNGMKVKVCDYGATLVSLIVPDKDGKDTDIVLGYDNVDLYQGASAFFGANVGRNANRIKGARCIIDGVEYNLESNDGDNGNNLHSGSNCTALKMWKAIYDENVNDKISFEILSKDMEQGFPGNLKVNLTYILTEDNELILNYKGTTDKITIANFTNHSYYNLNGHDSGEVYEQKLMINGDYFTPFATNNSIPSGEIRSVKGTLMDFTEMKSIGRDIDVEDEQLKFGTGYDHNFMINGNAHELRLAAKAIGDKSGIKMELYTDTPGLQLYTANFVSDESGKNGAVYNRRHAFCLEPQYVPDNINNDKFESAILKPDEEYNMNIKLKFL